MKIVQCPYCSVNFETIGFRPINFQCVQCGSDAEWYAGFANGEPRGLIAWNANDSTQSWLYNQYMSCIMQQIQQLELEIQMYLSQLKNNAQTVASKIMEAIAALTEQLARLNAEYKALIATNPEAAAEVMQDIEAVKQKIAVNRQLMVRIEQVILTIEELKEQLLLSVEQLKEMAEDLFYQTIDAITASNQEDLSSDSAIDEYSSEEEWKDFTRTITQTVNDISTQVQQVYLLINAQIQEIDSQIQR